ncbi:hypothetical protein VPH35_138326 [Triticum aestivum]|uniref:uncharacterized protein n=1 Tax=Triticum aestivum TaxID=4565 RepID=UPI001D024134|nr:uncharacterized protein LOC123168970 [Triticum aestivum]
MHTMCSATEGAGKHRWRLSLAPSVHFTPLFTDPPSSYSPEVPAHTRQAVRTATPCSSPCESPTVQFSRSLRSPSEASLCISRRAPVPCVACVPAIHEAQPWPPRSAQGERQCSPKLGGVLLWASQSDKASGERLAPQLGARVMAVAAAGQLSRPPSLEFAASSTRSMELTAATRGMQLPCACLCSSCPCACAVSPLCGCACAAPRRIAWSSLFCFGVLQFFWFHFCLLLAMGVAV